MAFVYGIFVVIILLIFWINWRLLIRWFRNPGFSGKKKMYWLITGLAWFFINYNWWFQPESDFFYRWITPLVDVAFIWIIGGSILLCLFPIFFAARRLEKQDRAGDETCNPEYFNASRRTFLQKMLYAAPVLSLGISAQGVYSAEREMVIQHISLSFHGLSRNLEGFKIAQISDTHLGPFFSLERLDEVLQLVIKEKPQLVVITGDLIDDLNLLAPAIQKLSRFCSSIPYGVYFCWGNHEYFRDINRIKRALADSPVHVLKNSNIAIEVGETKLYILGVDYPWPKDAVEKEKTRQQFLAKAEQDVPAGAFKVLLAHHPDFLFNAFSSQIPLTLSGHTHGGQVNILGKSLLPVSYRYMRGLYTENHSYGYVSPGTGQWVPFRIGCPPEIGIFTLKA